MILNTAGDKKGDPIRDQATAVNPQAFRRTFATWMQKTDATVKVVQGASYTEAVGDAKTNRGGRPLGPRMPCV